MKPAQRYPEATVGALIVDPEGRLLLLRSHKWGGKYVVPGGHVELGETLQAALHREVMEETGLRVYDIRFLLTQEFIFDPAFWRPGHFIFFDYACHTHGGEVRLNDEAEEYAWVTADEALNLPVEPYTEKAIRTYLARNGAENRHDRVETQAIEVIQAAPADRSVLANLLELYLYEFSELEELELGDDGRFGYGYLDRYWTEPGRYAFLIRVSGRLAGFALVRTSDAGETPLRSMAEFGILRRYRGRGVGKVAAEQIFDLFPGHWEVAEMAANLGAQAFWRRVIGEYTAGRFTESWRADQEPVGPVQRFSTGSQDER